MLVFLPHSEHFPLTSIVVILRKLHFCSLTLKVILRYLIGALGFRLALFSPQILTHTNENTIASYTQQQQQQHHGRSQGGNYNSSGGRHTLCDTNPHDMYPLPNLMFVMNAPYLAHKNAFQTQKINKNRKTRAVMSDLCVCDPCARCSSSIRWEQNEGTSYLRVLQQLPASNLWTMMQRLKEMWHNNRSKLLSPLS